MGKKILIIDDDATLREILSLGLQGAGYDTLMAINGEEAKNLVQQETPDIILVDLYMPIMDGVRFLRWLRGEAALTIPAVVFTGSIRNDTLREAEEAGATVILRKPVQMPQLLATLASLG
jgi:CheY-like chemotaxis protein